MPRVLCVENDVTLRESRCAVLKCSGYDAEAASPHLAEVVLRSQKFDLVVISWPDDRDLQRLVNSSDGAEVLVLEYMTLPPQLLTLVAQRLNRQQRP
jgi:DNA-binding response OmpR family regulator